MRIRKQYFEYQTPHIFMGIILSWFMIVFFGYSEASISLKIIFFIIGLFGLIYLIVYIIKYIILTIEIYKNQTKVKVIDVKDVDLLTRRSGYRQRFRLNLYGFKIITTKKIFYYFLKEIKEINHDEVETPFNKDIKKLRIEYYPKTRVIKRIIRK